MTTESKTKINEEKKEYLRGYLRAKKEKQYCERQIHELRLSKLLPSANIDDMPKGSDKRDLSDYAAKLDGLEREYEVKIAKCIERFKKIAESIEALENMTEQSVLQLRYIEGMKWEEICVELSYSWKGVHKIHSSALGNIQVPD